MKQIRRWFGSSILVVASVFALVSLLSCGKTGVDKDGGKTGDPELQLKELKYDGKTIKSEKGSYKIDVENSVKTLDAKKFSGKFDYGSKKDQPITFDTVSKTALEEGENAVTLKINAKAKAYKAFELKNVKVVRARAEQPQGDPAATFVSGKIHGKPVENKSGTLSVEVPNGTTKVEKGDVTELKVKGKTGDVTVTDFTVEGNIPGAIKLKLAKADGKYKATEFSINVTIKAAAGDPEAQLVGGKIFDQPITKVGQDWTAKLPAGTTKVEKKNVTELEVEGTGGYHTPTNFEVVSAVAEGKVTLKIAAEAGKFKTTDIVIKVTVESATGDPAATFVSGKIHGVAVTQSGQDWVVTLPSNKTTIIKTDVTELKVKGKGAESTVDNNTITVQADGLVAGQTKEITLTIPAKAGDYKATDIKIKVTVEALPVLEFSSMTITHATGAVTKASDYDTSKTLEVTFSLATLSGASVTKFAKDLITVANFKYNGNGADQDLHSVIEVQGSEDDLKLDAQGTKMVTLNIPATQGYQGASFKLKVTITA